MIAKLLERIHLLPGEALVRRNGPGYEWGWMVHDPRGRIAGGERIMWGDATFTFQKGKTHYAIVLIRGLRRDA